MPMIERMCDEEGSCTRVPVVCRRCSDAKWFEAFGYGASLGAVLSLAGLALTLWLRLS